MNPIEQFQKERAQAIDEMAKDEDLKRKSLDWMIHADRYKFTYNFTWLGRPIIKFPNDIVVLQEIIWEVKPDLIIETGVAHGGSLIFSASMLELLGGDGRVLGIDIDIRAHNREAIEAHPMFRRIDLIEGSSVAPDVVAKVKAAAAGKKRVLVVLDSLHTHDHVLKELELYNDLVSLGSYLVLPDTFIEYFPKGYYDDRPWDVGDNPLTAMRQFLATNARFIVDESRAAKGMITEALGGGYLKRVN
ncbi:MAG: cephalosporin hydroxylase [Betaproteobacteria bacterium]|nr:cephalosporin hydroxylase [Betaproteobacteria bacterium]